MGDFQSKFNRMGKGEGSGEGWGEGEGKGQGNGGTWKGDLCSSCDCGLKCFIGCCLPPIGNFFIAEKTGNDGFEKFIGFLDFCGGAGLCSAIGSMILRGKYGKEMELMEVQPAIAAQAFVAFLVYNVKWPITLALMSKMMQQSQRNGILNTMFNFLCFSYHK